MIRLIPIYAIHPVGLINGAKLRHVTGVLRPSKHFLQRLSNNIVMGHRLTSNFDQHHVDAFETMQEEGEADNYSEAVKRATDVGLKKMGYINGENSNTPLRKATTLLARWFTLAGLVLMGVTYFYPVELRLIAIAPVVSGLFLFGVERILADVEPDVTLRLKRLFGRNTA